jgi:hypothetical protein
MLPPYIHCQSQIYNFPDEMDDIRLAGLSISVRNVVSSMTSDPAIAIIFADPILQDLERMILYDETLQAIVAKILANDCDDDLADCRHLFKADLIARKLEEKTDDQEELKEENKEERSLCGDREDPLDDYGDQEEGTRLSVDEKKEEIETKALSGSCEKTSWPYKKVTIFKLFKL